MNAGKFAFKAFKNFVKFKSGKPSPLFASYNVTGRCNLRCVYCDWWKMVKPELPTGKALAVIDNLCSLGVAFFDFSGGEPLLREDLTILAGRASAHNCLVSVNTNATLLKRRKTSKIADAFDVVVVSMDGPEKLHDKIRGVSGVFQRAVETIKALKSRGVKVGVNSVISPYNIDIFPSFVEEIRSMVDFMQVQPVHPYPPPPENRLPADKVAALQECLLNLKREEPAFLAVPTDFIRGFSLFFEGKTPKICDAGRLYVAIDPCGNLLACAARGDVVLGNLLEASAEDILLGKVEDVKNGWVKVASCGGCWLECTVGVSMTVRNLKEAFRIAGLSWVFRG
ncbi:MAG: radical SAM protein [Candidatus Bathyarchaeota archaeon]|nr:radical SAM protein [Candidatus Bathyarchaeota archaeon]MDW8040872.1 radical SAM protein [Nitrososphaerota archaeon]